ncbi:hypothetical protein CPL00124_CDS0181 [Escherchia phage Stokescottia]
MHRLIHRLFYCINIQGKKVVLTTAINFKRPKSHSNELNAAR